MKNQTDILNWALDQIEQAFDHDSESDSEPLVDGGIEAENACCESCADDEYYNDPANASLGEYRQYINDKYKR